MKPRIGMVVQRRGWDMFTSPCFTVAEIDGDTAVLERTYGKVSVIVSLHELETEWEDKGRE